MQQVDCVLVKCAEKGNIGKYPPSVKIQCTGSQHTVNDISQALGVEQVSQTSHFILQFSDQLVVRIFIDDSIAPDLFSTVSISVGTRCSLGKAQPVKMSYLLTWKSNNKLPNQVLKLRSPLSKQILGQFGDELDLLAHSLNYMIVQWDSFLLSAPWWAYKNPLAPLLSFKI